MTLEDFFVHVRNCQQCSNDFPRGICGKAEELLNEAGWKKTKPRKEKQIEDKNVSDGN